LIYRIGNGRHPHRRRKSAELIRAFSLAAESSALRSYFTGGKYARDAENNSAFESSVLS